MCESSARLRAWVSCRVGWRLSVVCRGWSGAELRPERNLCIRKNTFVHRLPRTHSHKIIIRIALLQSLNSTHTAPRGAAPLSDNTNQYYAPFLRTLLRARRLDELQVLLERLILRIELDRARIVGRRLVVPRELAEGHATPREQLEQQGVRLDALITRHKTGTQCRDRRARVIDRLAKAPQA